MRLAILFPLTLTMLLTLPHARADDETDTPAPASAPTEAETLWTSHAKTFDLDGDGRITWEEYQKVTSGFARMDADKDGAITKDDLDKLGTTAPAHLGLGGMHVMLGQPGQPAQTVHSSLALPTEGNADDLARLLPLLQGLLTHGGFHGGGHGRAFHPHAGLPGGFGPRAWAGGSSCGCSSCDCRSRAGGNQQLMPLLAQLLQGRQGHPSLHHGVAPTVPSHATILQGPPQVTTRTITSVFPEGMKGLAAFGMVARTADQDDDHVITRAEWDAAVKAITKEDGSLDLTLLQKGVEVHGMPGLGGETSIFTTLLDSDGNGKVEAADLDSLFASMDKNKDGKVEATEMMPAGMGAMAVPQTR